MTASQETSRRLGNHGEIYLSKDECNPELGNDNLEELPGGSPREYVKRTKCSLDIQINIKKFGEVLQDGLDNTKEMAELWGWNNDHHELNWRDTPCSLRISYNKVNDIFKVQVWNELIQIWTKLSLTKAQMLKILEG